MATYLLIYKKGATWIDMDFYEMLVTIFGSIFASGGLWGFISKRFSREKNEEMVLKGLAHFKIIETGQIFIDRGWITKEELDDFEKYLADPYLDMGANGIAGEIIDRVKSLPFKKID